MTWCSDDSATPRFVLASSAIRCRFVNRFVSLRVLSRVSRQRFSSHGTPLPSIGSRWVQFPDVSSTIEVLRLPVTHPRSLIGFASRVHATLLGSCLAACARAPGRTEGAFRARVNVQPATRLPTCSRVDVSGISQVPRRSILCLCLVPGPRPNRRSLAYWRFHRCCPHSYDREGFSVLTISGLSRGFSTCCLRFKSGVATTHAKLASGRLARLYREGVEPSGSLQKVSDHILVPLFWIYPGATYGGFSPVRLEGWLVRRDLPNTSISLSLLPACTVRRPVCLRPSCTSWPTSVTPYWAGPRAR